MHDQTQKSSDFLMYCLSNCQWHRVGLGAEAGPQAQFLSSFTPSANACWQHTARQRVSRPHHWYIHSHFGVSLGTWSICTCQHRAAGKSPSEAASKAARHAAHTVDTLVSTKQA